MVTANISGEPILVTANIGGEPILDTANIGSPPCFSLSRCVNTIGRQVSTLLYELTVARSD